MTTLYVNPRGECSPLVAPVSRMGVHRSLILGIEVNGFVTLQEERGLRMMLWPEMEKDLIFRRLSA